MLKKLIMLLNREYPTSALVKRGLTVGKGFTRQQGCFIDPSHCFLIEIGDNVTFSLRVTVLAHDASTKKLIGLTRIGRVRIGSNVFVGANATILPGVTIGDDSVIGANSVVTKDVPKSSVAVGSPARVIGKIDALEEKNRELMKTRRVFDESYRMQRSLSPEKQEEMRKATEDGIAFID